MVFPAYFAGSKTQARAAFSAALTMGAGGLCPRSITLACVTSPALSTETITSISPVEVTSEGGRSAMSGNTCFTGFGGTYSPALMVGLAVGVDGALGLANGAAG